VGESTGSLAHPLPAGDIDPIIRGQGEDRLAGRLTGSALSITSAPQNHHVDVPGGG